MSLAERVAEWASLLDGIRKDLEGKGHLEKPFFVVIEITLFGDERDAQFFDLASRGGALSRAEPLCLQYEFSKSMTDPHTVYLHEKWPSFEGIKQHFHYEHTIDVLDALFSDTKKIVKATKAVTTLAL
jgi:quinol monooxygenase YgiN